MRYSLNEMTMNKQLITILFGFFLANSVIAESVVVPLGQQAADKQTIDRPRQGMNKDQVQQRYGSPKRWLDAVGEPPISRWIYDNFTVYFEYDTVIHSVLNHQAVN